VECDGDGATSRLLLIVYEGPMSHNAAIVGL
jgi:hypothetical protein